MNRLEIIEETVKYYSEDITRRAITEKGGCDYLTYEGKMCAVGRCMINPQPFYAGVTILNLESPLETLLKPEYRGHPIEFWAELQRLHDTRHYWYDQGLSNDGLFYLKKLKERWNE